MVFLFAGFKFAVAISVIVILISTTAPLAVFVRDFLENPVCMEISGRVVEEVNETRYLVELEIRYCSTIKARDVRIVFGETTIHVGTLERGTRVIRTVLSKTDVDKGFRSIELSIAGLYRLKVLYR